ncbi:hypothetical protein BU25DRAFT_238105 [Macroventuria anomochaeta]|uniref:Uncharacterized protein n=1 Tax=Macroventuria anomochaeta TaxID=301207 RepID=A0ACB6RHU8_9PLEO|nr:uncharacterized protein BU25DRAFT_238105 [Macroventuria anomochaeta]KAF2621461.1 hypothetical protein BU25DRAFT_238105 [Macroventuria anomochaeta]
MWQFKIFPAVLAFITTTQAAIKTSIWIDQIPGYSALAPCAENRISAIVRAQASGCGDNQQLTSFSCFCIDQSSYMASVISTAVHDYCAASATAVSASLATPLPEVTDAIDVFNSYCARSTELVWCTSLPLRFLKLPSDRTFTDQQTSTAPAIVVITPAPSSTFATSTFMTISSSTSQASTSSKYVPVAAIAAPVVIGVLAIASIVGLLFFLRRRKAVTAKENPYAPPNDTSQGRLVHREVHEVQSPAQEVVGDTVKYQHELETRPAELEGEKQTRSKR